MDKNNFSVRLNQINGQDISEYLYNITLFLLNIFLSLRMIELKH